MKTKSLKISIIFVIALLIGLWSGGFFERNVFKFSFVKNFSASEAKALQGKTVKDVCSKLYERKIGKIVGYEYSNAVFIRVRIKWEHDANFNWTTYPKSYFSRCIEVNRLDVK